MTGLDNRANQLEESTGPRIRHPSGTVYPNVIFMKERHDLNKFGSAAKLYQNILEYLPRHNPKKTFKITQMGYWLLQQNDDYRNYYTGSKAHTRASIRLENILKRIKRYFGNLVDWDLIECVAEVDSDTKNGQKTCLYRFTYVGDIVAWALEYYKFYNGYLQLGNLENLHSIKKIKQEIFELIKRLFSVNFDSYMTDFLLRFYTKCMDFDISNNCPFVPTGENKKRLGIGIFDQIILALVNILITDKFHFPKGIEYLSASHTFILTSKYTANVALRLYLMTLDEFPDKIKNIIMAHEKTVIESRFLTSQPTKDWEEAWLENINNHGTIVLYAVCQNKDCETRCYPVLMPYRSYREALVTASKTVSYNDGFPPLRHIIGDCQICKTKDGVFVFDSYENVTRCINQCEQIVTHSSNI